MAAKVKGLSLLEVIVALTIFLLASVFLVGLLPASSLGLKRSECRLFAGRLCQSELEKRMAQQNLAVGPLPAFNLDYQNVRYTVEGSVSAEVGSAGTPLPGLFRVRVRANWQERDRDYEVLRETLVRQQQ